MLKDLKGVGHSFSVLYGIIYCSGQTCTSAELLVLVRFTVSICCSFMEGELRARSRCLAQYKLQTAVRDTGTYPCIASTPSHISVSFLSFNPSHVFHIPSFPRSLAPLTPPHYETPPPPFTVILQYSFLPFMSASARFAPGRQWIKSSDR